MTDIRPFLNMELHVTVWLKGRCKNCNTTIKRKIFDYGTLPYKVLEEKLDKTQHTIEKINCPKCSMENSPESIIYFDEDRTMTIVEQKIDYGYLMFTDDSHSESMKEEHKQRFEIFKEKETEFWEQYTDYAILNWRDMINELQDFEIKDAFTKMNIETHANTISKLRKEVLNRINTIEEKQLFWKQANDYFIYHHLLEIGAMGWDVAKDIQYYGKKRMRFIILHFPLGEETEQLRTEWIGSVIQKNREDNAFLFRRISMLTSELNRLRSKITDYVHQIDKLKAEKTKLENKLHQAYESINRFENKKFVYNRDIADIEKIHELKSFVNDLIQELKEKERIIHKLNPDETSTENAPVLDENENKEEVTGDKFSMLKGKTVAIIGGRRQEQAQKEYVCQILTHPGESLDQDFYQTLKKADILVLLTQFIPHLTMWEAKAYAIENDKPIYYTKRINIQKILSDIVE